MTVLCDFLSAGGEKSEENIFIESANSVFFANFSHSYKWWRREVCWEWNRLESNILSRSIFGALSKCVSLTPLSVDSLWRSVQQINQTLKIVCARIPGAHMTRSCWVSLHRWSLWSSECASLKTNCEINREERKIVRCIRRKQKHLANLRWRGKFILNLKIFIVLRKAVLSSCLHAKSVLRASPGREFGKSSLDPMFFGANKSYSCQKCHLFSHPTYDPT